MRPGVVTEFVTEQHVPIVVALKAYNGEWFIGLGVAGDGGDLTADEARTLISALTAAAEALS